MEEWAFWFLNLQFQVRNTARPKTRKNLLADSEATEKWDWCLMTTLISRTAISEAEVHNDLADTSPNTQNWSQGVASRYALDVTKTKS